MGQHGSSALSGSNSQDDESKEVSSIPTPHPSNNPSSSPIIMNNDQLNSSANSPSKGSYYGSLRVNQMYRKNQATGMNNSPQQQPSTPQGINMLSSTNNENRGLVNEQQSTPTTSSGMDIQSKRREIKKKGGPGLTLLATSFSRRDFGQDLIGEEDTDVTTSRTGVDSSAGVFTSFRTSRNYLRSHMDDSAIISKNDIGEIVHHHADHQCLSLYPKSHYDYYNRRMHQLIDSYFEKENFDWTIHLDPENDPQFYEIAFSMFESVVVNKRLSPPKTVIPFIAQYNDDEYEEESDPQIIDDDYFIHCEQPTKSSPRQIQSNSDEKREIMGKKGISPSCSTSTVETTGASATTMPSLVSTTLTTSSTVISNETMIMSSLANTTLGSPSTSIASSNYLSSPNSFQRPRGRAFLMFGSSQSPSSSTQQNSYLLSPSMNSNYNPTPITPLRSDSAISTTLNPSTTTPKTPTPSSEKKTSPHDLKSSEKKIPKSPRECRRECYSKVLNARFEYGGWKDNCDFGKRSISLSQLEESVPYEIMFHILSYLSAPDLIDLSRVSRSFHYIWTEHPLLWISYPYNLNNLSMSDLSSSSEFAETFDDREKKQGSSFIDHITLRELIESSPFSQEKTTMVLSSWKNIYKSIYKGYRNGPWMNYCAFHNNVNTQSLEYRLSMIEIKVCLIGDSTSGKSSWVYMLKEAISNHLDTVEHRSRVKKIEYIESTIGATYLMKHVKVNLPTPTGTAEIQEDDDSISSEADSYIMTRYNPIISLSVWDTSGMKRFLNLIPLYLKVCKAIMLCFDLSRPESFDDMLQLFDKYIFKQQATKSPELNLLENRNLFEKCLQNEDIYVFVCGLKSDLEPKISNERITQFLHSYGGSRIKLFTNNMLYFELSSMSGENLYTPWLHLAYRVALKNQSDGASSSASSGNTASSISSNGM
ncbi:rab family small GTPase [Naegleria gruberi]|uniref:Rab family small GTPase n=1 Tax=Naegleria gruberi TaxID=5762 RepID=D2VGL1_NAEGR|nr:rab family small GTPase [Naegleria gruberi]EFC44084.1 rab family small GTPase [Naegleria gruberi]|eukprot:XP_002676828.1 rab family small GTPase [Naegleria gruberi strain NEG-M]